VAAAFERAMAGCRMVSTDQTREAAEDTLLGLSAERRTVDLPGVTSGTMEVKVGGAQLASARASGSDVAPRS
jgi:hypothetical protein